jgi:hypothetical protein
VRRLRITWAGALLASAATIATTRDAAAEKEVALGAGYDTRVPVGSFRRVIPNASFAGFQARWDFFPVDSLSIGLDVQYNLFKRDTKTDTLAIADGAITATTFRYASLWSFLPTVRYYFVPRGPLRPYASLSAGVTAVTSVALVSDLSQRELSAAFITQPSAGVLVRLTPDRTARAAADNDAPPLRKPLESMVGLTASVTYAFTTADVAGTSNISHAGIQIGIYAKP